MLIKAFGRLLLVPDDGFKWIRKGQCEIGRLKMMR